MNLQSLSLRQLVKLHNEHVPEGRRVKSFQTKPIALKRVAAVLPKEPTTSVKATAKAPAARQAVDSESGSSVPGIGYPVYLCILAVFKHRISYSRYRGPFEMFWEPKQTTVTSGTSKKARGVMKFDDPAGFSGSLVWNTRYREVTESGEKWRPSHAVVTGIARRYDPATKTLLVLRVEHLRAALERHGS